MLDGQSQLNFADLDAMVTEKVEETVRLEFKRQLPDTGKNDDLARSLAAMANTEGGSIIYGVEEDDDGRAKALHPFEVGKSADRVTLVAGSAIDEPLLLSNVYAIADERKPELGYLVVTVPKSDRAPHLIDGKAWGRTAKTGVGLSRRHLGELFARSPSFAQEFGLVVGKPGRILVRTESEAFQQSTPFEPGKIETQHNHFLVFENDGDTEVFDAVWEWVTEGEGMDDTDESRVPIVSEDPFPLDVLPAGAQARVNVIMAIDTGSVAVRTRWRDVAGNLREAVWPTVW